MLDLLSGLVRLYSFLIILRLILGNIEVFWTQSGAPAPESGFLDVLKQITDPWLNLFRKHMYKGSGIDFSPMWALITLHLIRGLLKLGAADRISLGGVIAVFYTTLWGLFSFLNILAIILLIIRTRAQNRNDIRGQQIRDAVDKMLYTPAYIVYRCFYKNRPCSEEKLIRTMLGTFVALEITGWIISMVLTGIFLT
ncbi:MAG: YggT family protein [Spirochaetales bacterium]|nr:YggT family protein [Spirochaetales bacterium]